MLTGVATAVVSSAVVAAVVGALSSFVTQRYLLVRKAQIDAEAMERKALLDYQSLARQRLLDSIGPLRMQLLFGARDAVHRINSHGMSERGWNMDIGEHYARTTIYRILRPLAVAQLIERMMGVADFTVDEDAVGLLRFGTAAERMLSSGEVVMDHPRADWARQTQHLFRDNLRSAAARLIVDGQDRPKVLGYEEFKTEIPDPLRDDDVAALAELLRGCRLRMTENPIFWLRLVGYAYACRELIREQGVRISFSVPTLSPADLLRKVSDEHILLHVDDYVLAMQSVVEEGL